MRTIYLVGLVISILQWSLKTSHAHFYAFPLPLERPLPLPQPGCHRLRRRRYVNCAVENGPPPVLWMHAASTAHNYHLHLARLVAARSLLASKISGGGAHTLSNNNASVVNELFSPFSYLVGKLYRLPSDPLPPTRFYTTANTAPSWCRVNRK